MLEAKPASITARVAGLIGVIFLMGFTFYCGYTGRDFGTHWDEFHYPKNAQLAHEYHSWLPGWYNYPSFTYYLSLPAVYSEGTEGLFSGEIAWRDYYGIYLRGRMIFLGVSVCLILFTYLACRSYGLGIGASVWAASLPAFSFEFTYHGRWMAPDAVMAAFVALALWMLVLYVRQGKQQWLFLASAATGMATGTKYPGILMMTPLFWAVMVKPWSAGSGVGIFRDLKEKLVLCGMALGVCLIVFLITTPGALLEFPIFYNNILHEARHYQEGHQGHEVTGWFDHGVRMMQYFIFILFAEENGLSVVAAGLAGAGLLFMLMRQTPMSVVMVFPVVYLGFFAMQKVMIVRNYLVMLPFLALLAGVGWQAVWNSVMSVSGRAGKVMKAGAGVLMVCVTLWMMGRNANANRDAAQRVLFAYQEERFNNSILDFISEHPEQRILCSRKVYDYLKYGVNALVPDNVYVHPDGTESDNTWVLFYSKDIDYYWRVYEANHYDYIIRDFGPGDVNFAYYPSWPSTHALFMPWKYAKKVGLEFY